MRQPSPPPSLILPSVLPSAQPSAQLSQMHGAVPPLVSSVLPAQSHPQSHPLPSVRPPRSLPSSEEAARSEHAVSVSPVPTPMQRSQVASNRNYGTINDDASSIRQRSAREPLLGPPPAQTPGTGWRNAAHVTDLLAAVSSAPYPGSLAPVVQGTSGLLWAGSGLASGVDNLQQQPENRREHVARGIAVFSDVTASLAGLADTANAATNAFAPDAHDWRRGTGQASNALWAASGLASMASTGYQAVSNWWNGRPSLSQGLGFASATFNTLGAGFGMVANEYQQHDDAASQMNATLYGTLSAASWVTGSLFSIGSTIAARRQQNASVRHSPSDEV